jgi:hypothetical protein
MGVGAAIVLALDTTPARRVAARAVSPDKSLVAIAFETPCGGGHCQQLEIGTSDGTTAPVTRLDGRRCDEIVWTPDGKRVGFVLDGAELSLYDAAARKLAGTVRLLTSEAARTRLARGVTFSETGRAVTFDDCPRTHAGCRAGLVGIPQ